MWDFLFRANLENVLSLFPEVGCFPLLAEVGLNSLKLEYHSIKT